MASQYDSIESGTGMCWITDSAGALNSANGIIASFKNKAPVRATLMAHAMANSASNVATTQYPYYDASTTTRTGSISRFRYWIYSSGGVEGTVHASAEEITNMVTFPDGNFLYPTALDVADDANVRKLDANGAFTYERRGGITVLEVDVASGSADTMQYITEKTRGAGGGGPFDILIIKPYDVSNKITVIDYEGASGNANIMLDNKNNWDSGASDTLGVYDRSYLILINNNANYWQEISRVPSINVSKEKLRDAGIPVVDGGDGKFYTIASGGATETALIPGTDTDVVYVSGTATLGADYTIPLPETATAKVGDRFVTHYAGSITDTASHKVSIFGIELESSDALNGGTYPVEVEAVYMGTAANTKAWKANIKKNTKGAEDYLGNPASDGMLLSSTAAGVRSWTSTSDTMKVKKFTYSFAAHGGAVSTIQLATADVDGIPKGAIIDASRSVIQTETIVTSGGAADIAIGLTCSSTTGGYQATDIDFFLANQDFDAAPFTALGSVTKGPANIGMLYDTASPTIKITTAALTAGVINIYVAYYAAG